MPVCFCVLHNGSSGPTVVYSPIDEKPKRSADGRSAADARSPADLGTPADPRSAADLGTPADLRRPADLRSPADPRSLARVRDILHDSRVSLLVERWDEDWSRLAWLRLEGTATLLEPIGAGASEHAEAVEALRTRYPQYESHRLEERPMLRIQIWRWVSWGALD